MNETGLGVALAHLRLAVHALWQPLQQQFRLHPPPMSAATRIYLLDSAALYAAAAAAFLLPLHQVRIGVTGIALVDGRLPHVLWGISVLVVCLSQIAAMFTNRWSVWLVATVGTAMWASCWAVVTLLLAHQADNYAGAVLWCAWVVVHFLFIGNRFVPIPDSVVSPQDRAAAAAEQQLIERFTQAVKGTDSDSEADAEHP